MNANFTSVVLENGLLPIASSIQKRLGLNPGDRVRISLKVLNRTESHARQSRYANLMAEKDIRVLTLQEQAELVALANAELDEAIAHAKRQVQKKRPELFDKEGKLKRAKALASLRRKAKKA